MTQPRQTIARKQIFTVQKFTIDLWLVEKLQNKQLQLFEQRCVNNIFALQRIRSMKIEKGLEIIFLRDTGAQSDKWFAKYSTETLT